MAGLCVWLFRPTSMGCCQLWQLMCLHWAQSDCAASGLITTPPCTRQCMRCMYAQDGTAARAEASSMKCETGKGGREIPSAVPGMVSKDMHSRAYLGQGSGRDRLVVSRSVREALAQLRAVHEELGEGCQACVSTVSCSCTRLLACAGHAFNVQLRWVSAERLQPAHGSGGCKASREGQDSRLLG